MACLPRFRFRLGVPDLVFGIVLVTILSGSVQLLNDPGTFWHARLGREIARTGDVPRLDVLTFTRDHAPWIDQSWAFDWGLAAVVDRWGWSAAVALASLGLAALYGIMARGLIRDGTSPLIAFSVTLFAAWVGTIHFLIRPHLFTFGFFYWTLRSCQMQHKRGGWAIASLPLVMVLWANVHGGFLAGLVIVGTAAVAHAISGSWDQARRVNLARFAGIFLLCSLAPLINPYGVGLYRHVGQFVSGAASLTLEFQPIQFGQGQARLVEWVLLALIAIPTFSSRRMDRYNLAHALVWLHLALVSVRHAPLFAMAVAPGLAQVLDGLTHVGCDGGRDRTGWSIWPAATALVILLGVCLGIRFARFDPKIWPLQAVPALDCQPLEARLFHELDWGGLIESECRPVRQAFIDDRCELFGKSAIDQYQEALHGGPDWEAIRDRERIELVWVRPQSGLARRLTADPSWQILHRDPVSILFRRRAESETKQASHSTGVSVAIPEEYCEITVRREGGG